MTVKDISGEVAIVTGGGSGLGRGAALAFARRGANIVVVDIDLPAADETSKLVREAGGEALAFQADVSQPDVYERIRKAALEKFGKYHIVMNNVAVLASGRPEATPISEWERVFDTNVISMARSIKVFLDDLLAQGRGHIVNVASTAALFPYAYDRLSYAASKAGVISLSEGLALYCLPRGVGVTVFCPGPMTTNIRRQMKFWGGRTAPRGPGEEFVSVSLEEAGESLVKAVVEGQVVGFTHPKLTLAKLKAKYDDWDGFVKAQAARIYAEDTAQATDD